VQITERFRQALNLIFKSPYVLLLALLAVVSDIWAVWAYDPHGTTMPLGTFILALLSLLAEAGLIYAFAQQIRGQTSSLIDALVAPMYYLAKILVSKLVILIILALYLLLFFLLAIFPESMPILGWVLVVPLLALLIVLQLWTFFTLCEILIREHGVGEALPRGWRFLVEHRGQLLRLVVVFLAIDLAVLLAFIVLGGLSFESVFEYSVTEEMAKLHTLTGSGPAEAGTYFSIGRLVSGFLASALKARGTDLLSLSIFGLGNRALGLIAAVAGALLLLLRIPILTQFYLELSGPFEKVSDDMSLILKEHLAARRGQTTPPTPE
jgi:hypothetical protein